MKCFASFAHMRLSANHEGCLAVLLRCIFHLCTACKHKHAHLSSRTSWYCGRWCRFSFHCHHEACRDDILSRKATIRQLLGSEAAASEDTSGVACIPHLSN